MQETQRTITTELLRRRNIDYALFAAPASITWLTGFANPIQTGPGPFASLPPLLWYEDGIYTLLLPQSRGGDAQGCGCQVVTYADYALESGFGDAGRLTEKLTTLVGRRAAIESSLGIEAAHVPALLLQKVMQALGIEEWQAIDGWLRPLRARKNAEEVALLRKSFELTAVGHECAAGAVRPGRCEIDVWSDIQAAIQRAAGERVPLGYDCIVSRREMNIGGWPADFEIHGGDSLIVDLGARVGGYWSDSCATYYASELSRQQRELHHTVLAALELAISLVKPGAVAGEIDRQVREVIENGGFPVYPHHTGHGVGVTSHEEPRIVPGNPQTLESGMVVMLEPGIYLPGKAAVRLEDAVLVTPDGAELLTTHNKDIVEEAI